VLVSGWRVLIVEDDPTVSYVHRELIKRSGRFRVVDIVDSGELALASLKRSQPELVILDLQLAGMNGLRLLRTLRGLDHPAEVIAVTASASPDVVRRVVQLGVIDYLVKPFEPERLEQALGLFLRRMAALKHGRFEQTQIDAYTSSGRAAPRWLPKGLAVGPLREVRGTLSDGLATSAEEIAGRLEISRVTARRYLEYLVTVGEARVELHSAGPGRPRKLYRRAGGVNSIT